jgi:hypothetical protein
MDGIRYFSIELGRQVMSHAVDEHQLSSGNRRGCILPTSRENQWVICPVYHESRCNDPTSRGLRSPVAAIAAICLAKPDGS